MRFLSDSSTCYTHDYTERRCGERGAPLGGHLPLHQEPSASLCGQYQPLPLVLGFMAPCVGHWGVVSTGAAGVLAGACAVSHAEASSTCALTLAKSTPRKVTSTSWPPKRAFSVMLTGASGKGG